MDMVSQEGSQSPSGSIASGLASPEGVPQELPSNLKGEEMPQSWRPAPHEKTSKPAPSTDPTSVDQSGGSEGAGAGGGQDAASAPGGAEAAVERPLTSPTTKPTIAPVVFPHIALPGGTDPGYQDIPRTLRVPSVVGLEPGATDTKAQPVSPIPVSPIPVSPIPLEEAPERTVALAYQAQPRGPSSPSQAQSPTHGDAASVASSVSGTSKSVQVRVPSSPDVVQAVPAPLVQPKAVRPAQAQAQAEAQQQQQSKPKPKSQRQSQPQSPPQRGGSATIVTIADDESRSSNEVVVRMPAIDGEEGVQDAVQSVIKTAVEEGKKKGPSGQPGSAGAQAGGQPGDQGGGQVGDQASGEASGQRGGQAGDASSGAFVATVEPTAGWNQGADVFRPPGKLPGEWKAADSEALAATAEGGGEGGLILTDEGVLVDSGGSERVERSIHKQLYDRQKTRDPHPRGAGTHSLLLGLGEEDENEGGGEDDSSIGGGSSVGGGGSVLGGLGHPGSLDSGLETPMHEASDAKKVR